MSLDGLRAWIGEVERKLGMRTRVFLVLVAIAVGGAAAGIYLALEAANESVSKDEVQALQERASGAVPRGETETATALEAKVESLKAEVEALREQASGSVPKSTAPGPTGSGGSAPEEGTTPPAAEPSPSGKSEEQHK